VRQPSTTAVGLFATLVLCSACPPASNLGLSELKDEYAAKFYVSDRTLVVTIENVPGINVAGITPVVSDDGVVLQATRISSGGGGQRVFCVELSSYPLEADWIDRIWWAEPNAELVRVEPITTGEEARRLTTGCS
jgi:hypothetical protein